MPANRNVKVVTPEAELEFAIQSSTTGKQLFDQVVRTLGLREIWYFGLQFTDTKGFVTWLLLNKKVQSQDVPKAGMLEFKLRVKFYPEDVGEDLIQEATIRMFYLQVKEAILSGSVFCPAESAVLLASYACQAKHGDEETADTPADGYDRILPARVLEEHTIGSDEWKSRIIRWWSELKGNTREDAMLEYLRVAQDLDMFGINYFDIKNKKGTDLFLGVDALGINVYERSDKITPRVGFPWSEIRNICYGDRKFTIKPVDKNSPNFVFVTGHVRINKHILALCMGNHELYIRRRKPDTIEVQQMRTQAKEERESKRSEREKLDKEKKSREELLLRQEEMTKKMQDLEEERIRKEQEQEEMNQRLKNLMIQMEEERERTAALQASYEEEKRLKLLMEEEKDQTSQEFASLREQYDSIQGQIGERQDELESVQKEREEAQQALDQAKEEREELLRKATEYEELLARQASIEQEATVGHELQIVENGAQSELERQTLMEQNQKLQSQLELLARELSSARTEAVDPMTNIHDENVRKGMDKFRTLRQIRQGNTKKRVYEFESM